MQYFSIFNQIPKVTSANLLPFRGMLNVFFSMNVKNCRTKTYSYNCKAAIVIHYWGFWLFSSEVGGFINLSGTYEKLCKGEPCRFAVPRPLYCIIRMNLCIFDILVWLYPYKELISCSCVQFFYIHDAALHVSLFEYFIELKEAYNWYSIFFTLRPLT